MPAFTSHHMGNLFQYMVCKGSVCSLQHWCPFVEDSVLHGRFRVGDTRTSQRGSCSTDQQHHHCLPRVIRTHTALCICVCCRRGRLTREGVCCVLSQAAPAWDLHHALYQLKEGRMISYHLIFLLFDSTVEPEEYCWLEFRWILLHKARKDILSASIFCF